MLADIASEMLYPVIPLYLRTIGFTVLLIGILEGVAEATAGLSKGYFGKRSDYFGKRMPFVRLGYLFSALAKPMMVVLSFPAWVFGARTLDRLGKGIRTGARDAILSDETTPGHKGKVFGFHRGWDTVGAVLGPMVALVYLHFHPGNYIPLFLIAFGPGLLSVLLTLLVKEKNSPPRQTKSPPSLLSFFRYWNTSPLLYRKVAKGLLLFALFNSSDMLLLLKIRQSGLNDTALIGVYIFYNVFYAIFSYPLGYLADRIGFRPTYLGGLLLFAIVYAAMAFTSSLPVFFLLFFLYGVYAAATDGVSKAWITNTTDKRETATAIGTFTAFQSIASLIASSVAGFIWYRYGAADTFLLTAAATLVAVIYLSLVKLPGEVAL